MRTSCALFLVCALAVPAAVRAGGNAPFSPLPKSSKAGPASTAPRPPPGVASPNAVREAAADQLVFGAPIHYQNLTVVPVGTTEKGPFQRYTLLEQGLARGTLSVRELQGASGQAQVAAVEVRNTGTDPVYLLGGEMILGGQQDRIIERDTVVPPGPRWARVSVFCVEQGRWHGQAMSFAGGEALAHVGLRQAALSGDQSRVWAEVARKNLQHGTQSASGTYRRTIQKPALRAEIAPYRRTLVERMPADLQVAGLVFAINGEVRVADLFGNPVLFGDLRDKLLSAYILEALGQRVVRDAKPLSVDAAKGFLLEGRRAPREALKPSGGRSKSYKRESVGLVGTETFDADGATPVHESYIRK